MLTLIPSGRGPAAVESETTKCCPSVAGSLGAGVAQSLAQLPRLYRGDVSGFRAGTGRASGGHRAPKDRWWRLKVLDLALRAWESAIEFGVDGLPVYRYGEAIRVREHRGLSFHIRWAAPTFSAAL